MVDRARYRRGTHPVTDLKHHMMWKTSDLHLPAADELRDDLNGVEYQPLVPNGAGRMPSQQLQLSLLHWRGSYRGVPAIWLRWATSQGELLLTGEERVEQERHRAEQERQRAERAKRSLRAARERIAELEARLQTAEGAGKGD